MPETTEADLRAIARDPGESELRRLTALERLGHFESTQEQLAAATSFYLALGTEDGAEPVARAALLRSLQCAKASVGASALRAYLCEQIERAPSDRSRTRMEWALSGWEGLLKSLVAYPAGPWNVPDALSIVPRDSSATVVLQPVSVVQAGGCSDRPAQIEMMSVFLSAPSSGDAFSGPDGISIEGAQGGTGIMDAHLGGEHIRMNGSATPPPVLDLSVLEMASVEGTGSWADWPPLVVDAEPAGQGTFGHGEMVVMQDPARNRQQEALALDRMIVASIYEDVRQGRKNRRNPELRKELIWFLEDHPFTSDAYDVFIFLLEGAAGNTADKRIRSLLTWAQGYEEGRYEELLTYYTAYHLYRTRSYDRALAYADQYLGKFAAHHDRAQVLKALCLVNRNRAAEAIALLGKIPDEFPESPLVPQARFLTAWAYVYQQEPAKARPILEEIEATYPQSEYAQKAAQLLATLPPPQ